MVHQAAPSVLLSGSDAAVAARATNAVARAVAAHNAQLTSAAHKTVPQATPAAATAAAIAAAAAAETHASESHNSDSDTDSCSDMPPLIPIIKQTVQCCSCFEREAVVHRLDCGHFMCCRECEVIIQGWGASTDASECLVCSEPGSSG